MSVLAAGKINYRVRIERAQLLSEHYPFAREILSFYKRIAQFQKELYEQLAQLLGNLPVSLDYVQVRSQFHAQQLLEPFRKFLSLVAAEGPAPLSAHSEQLRSRGKAVWADLLRDFWERGMLETGAKEPLTDFLARAVLQPYAEFLFGSQMSPALLGATCRCPRCNSLPLLGVLRPEGDGGKRFLQCSFCSHEWEFRRILCANCGEEQEQQLPVYIAEQFPQIRVECCESCKKFLRTIDLTKDGHAIPIVDDLAAIPLSLWAQENGYSRIQDNLLGT
jgi:FdhE protein